MVYEVLGRGADQAVTAARLSDLLGMSRRDITRAIQRERLAGKRICASSSPIRPGYYRTDDTGEIIRFCKRLECREGEIRKTRRALLQAAGIGPRRHEKTAPGQLHLF